MGVVIVAVVGCGTRLARVEGVILVDGQPVEEGTSVLFCPLGSPSRPATSRVGTAGRFIMQTNGQAGVMPGRYKVAITNSTNSVEPPVFAGDPDPFSPEFQAYEIKVEKFLAQPARPGAVPLIYSSMVSTPLEWRVPEDGRQARFEISSNVAGQQ
jgi:hypothetical protein